MNTSEHQVKKNKEPRPPKACGWMAEFENEHDLLHAAEKVRDAGYTKTDAFTPFPVHGIDHALGIKPTSFRESPSGLPLLRFLYRSN